MNNNHKISIIMPAYNCAHSIAFSIQSVISQVYKNWELLIVNDASTDDTPQIIEYYCNLDFRIKLFNLKTNQGVSKARNYALERRQGDFVAFLDSDDIWFENKLSTQLSSMLASNSYFSYMSYDIKRPSNNINRQFIPPPFTNYQNLLRGNCIGTLTVMLNSDHLGNLRFPNIGHEDYALWLSLLRNDGIAYRSGGYKSYAQYNVHRLSLSSSKWKSANWQWKIYRETEHLSRVTSSFLFLNYAYKAIRKRI